MNTGSCLSNILYYSRGQCEEIKPLAYVGPKSHHWLEFETLVPSAHVGVDNSDLLMTLRK